MYGVGVALMIGGELLLRLDLIGNAEYNMLFAWNGNPL